jgi:alpha-tubulin suppressor-like RCC1 family protein
MNSRAIALACVVLLGACSETTAPAASRAYVSVATGGDHSCAVARDGSAYCWGRGTDGELGTGTTSHEFTARKVASDVAFQNITAGDAHTCALATDQHVYCWGWDIFFQRGNSANTQTTVPVPVQGTVRFTAVSAGAHHTCALATDSRVYCWGYNRYGQMGNGRTQTVIGPEPVADLRAVAVTAGGYHSCALTEDGAALCWGRNDFGQLGIGSDAVMVLEPRPVPSSVAFNQIDAGATHTCAVAVSGEAYCWGSNQYGEIGDGAAFKEGLPGPTTPSRVLELDDVELISAGNNVTCAARTGGQAACWGFGTFGQLANGDTDNFASPQPTSASDGVPLGFTRLDTNGYTHACGVSNEVVLCWGAGTSGQLGRGLHTATSRPSRINQ